MAPERYYLLSILSNCTVLLFYSSYVRILKGNNADDFGFPFSIYLFVDIY